jgi:hypothetical protein
MVAGDRRGGGVAVTRLAALARAERSALTVLAGCPAGATVEALHLANNVALETIARLIGDGYAAIRVQRYRAGEPVWWVFITGAGLTRLQARE